VAKKLEIELVRSTIGCPQWMRRVAQSLALRKLHSKVVMPDNGAIRGMIKRIPHLVSVREVEG
jgi:large subunit ribosomal protein L30